MKNTVLLPSVNHSALESFEAENPSATSLRFLNKSETAYLVKLGADRNSLYRVPRFSVLGTSSAKTEKGELKGWLTGISYLSPALESGFANLCPWAGNCKAVCLNTAGRGAFNSVQKARRLKTFRLFHFGADVFLLNAILDLRAIAKKAVAKGFGIACRLDGTSDLGLVNLPLKAFGYKNIAQVLPSVSFYEYSKSESRMLSFLAGEMPKNVHLTFSLDGEKNRLAAQVILKHGGNVAVCFDALPEDFMGSIVLDGDESDLRFLDPKKGDCFGRGFIIGLKAKGKAKRIKNGFVQAA